MMKTCRKSAFQGASLTKFCAWPLWRRAQAARELLLRRANLLMVRKALGEGFAIVTPGIRPAGAETNDQQRIATPAQAISNGASHIVVGRPITHAPRSRQGSRSHYC